MKRGGPYGYDRYPHYSPGQKRGLIKGAARNVCAKAAAAFLAFNPASDSRGALFFPSPEGEQVSINIGMTIIQGPKRFHN